jgi:HEAT repeat protein
MNKNEDQNNEDIKIALKKMREAFPKAVDTLIELLASKNEGVKLQAARAIRDLILGKFNK